MTAWKDHPTFVLGDTTCDAWRRTAIEIGVPERFCATTLRRMGYRVINVTIHEQLPAARGKRKGKK